MQTSYLKHFVAAAELGSISAAACESFITPQGMSRSISVLESELGCQLFKRTQNRIVLTGYGEALLEDAKEILRVQQGMLDRIAAIRSNEVEISTKSILLYLNSVAFDTALFYPLTDSFEQIFANARYYQCDNETVVDKLLRSGENDEALAVGLLCFFSPDGERNDELIAKLQSNGFEYQPYLDSYDQVLVSKKSDLATKRHLSRADILSRPIVSSSGDIERVAVKLFGEKSIYMVTADSAFRHHVVANDTAITFVPAFHNLTAVKDASTAIVPMKDPYYLEIGFAGKKGVLESPYLKSVLRKLNSYYSRYSDSPYLSLISSDLTLNMPNDKGMPLDDGRLLDRFASKHDISPRESEVLAFLLKGFTAQAIADALFVSVPTAKSHIYSIYKKANIHSHKELLTLFETETIGARS